MRYMFIYNLNLMKLDLSKSNKSYHRMILFNFLKKIRNKIRRQVWKLRGSLKKVRLYLIILIKSKGLNRRLELGSGIISHIWNLITVWQMKKMWTRSFSHLIKKRKSKEVKGHIHLELNGKVLIWNRKYIHIPNLIRTYYTKMAVT